MTPRVRKRKARVLEEDLYRKQTRWFRRAVAYRLLHTLLPAPITRRLPRRLRGPFLAPGITLPPGIEPPPGTVIPPTAAFPPGWTPADPLPPGVTLAPAAVFPPGWTPADPLPPGVTLAPGAVFPPGWTPADPLPPGILPGPPLVPPVDSPTPPPHLVPGPGAPLPVKQPQFPAGAWVSHFGSSVSDGCGDGYGTDKWETRVDACYSDANGFYVGGPAGIDLQAIGSWLTGYRPTHVSFTVTENSQIVLEDADGNTIASSADYESGTPLEITGQTADIDYIELPWTFSGYLTDILFFA